MKKGNLMYCYIWLFTVIFMPLYNYIPFIIIITGAVFSVWLKKLTITGALAGSMCAIFVYLCAGYTGIALMAAFFVTATIATAWQRSVKYQLKAAEANDGRRNAGQVLANAGAAALACVLNQVWPAHAELWQLMIAASFAAATADTLSSEAGMVCGRRFYNILTFKPDKPGLDGVISLEGTAIGAAGSLLIALVYAYGTGRLNDIVILVICGTAGNIADSVLGATLERKGWVTNNMVNFLNTVIAAISAACFMLI